MGLFKNQLVTKGLFGLAAVALVGSTTAVYAAVNDTNNTTTGYGNTSQQATAAAYTFANSVNQYNDDFVNQVEALSNQAKTRLANDGPVNNFDSKFNTASDKYYASLNTAFNTFLSRVQNSANTAESKDQFIDQFNNAKADYLNQLDAAKNTFANDLSPLGDNANQTKDQFIGGYNSARDNYSNKLEEAKNTFAATVSNLR